MRDRKEDLPLLAHHFLRIFATEMGMEMPTLSLEALAVLESYHFPGNVRELKNIIERALIESSGAEILPEHLRFIHTSLVSPKLNGTEAYATSEKELAAIDLPLNLQQAEVILIKRSLAQAKGNMAEAARLLGINRTKLYRKIAQVEFDSK